MEKLLKNAGRGLSVSLAAVFVIAYPYSGKWAKQAKSPQHEVRVINVEVPVRVFKGDSFIDSFGLDEFVLTEDGVPQKIEALYLVKRATVERKEEVARAYEPDLSRHFYLFFVCYEYTPKIRDAIVYFVDHVLQTKDSLVVVTPRSSYAMKRDLLEKTPKEKIAEKLTGIVRKDILAGDAAYRSALTDLKRMVQSANDVQTTKGMDYSGGDAEAGDGGMDDLLFKYRSDLKRLEELRRLDENKLLQFPEALRALPGRKYAYLFYQREYIPVLDKKVLERTENDTKLAFLVSELMDLYKRDQVIDIGRLKKAYADSSITAHFLYLTISPDDLTPSQAAEHSEDVFTVFASLAEVTGGLTTSSQNAAYMMEKASAASENYYLLYYSPQNRVQDGTYREIHVSVKAAGFRISHRAGYLAK